MQLDLFDHSRDVMLQSDVIRALEMRDAAAAHAACERLAQEFPRDDLLPVLRTLASALADAGSTASLGDFENHAAVRQAREALETDVRPAVLRVFGPADAQAWLAPLRERLALRARPLPFDPSQPAEHCGVLWLAAGNWNAAAQVVATIESWRRIPAPLAWMIEARLKLFGLQAAWPMIAELGWMAPARLDVLLRQSDEPLLAALLHQFDAQFDGAGDAEDAAWFAAWALIERPEVAPHIAAAQPGQHGAPEQATRLLIELLGLERQGRQRDIANKRKALRDLHRPLFDAYMKTR